MKLTIEQARETYKGAEIHEGAEIREGAVIRKGAEIYKGAVIYEAAVIHEGAVIYEGAVIRKGAVIREGAEIYEASVIGEGRKNVKNSLAINGIGKTGNITAYHCEDGLIVNIGCANDYKGLPVSEMRERIAEKYPSDHEYFVAMDLIEKWGSK